MTKSTIPEGAFLICPPPANEADRAGTIWDRRLDKEGRLPPPEKWTPETARARVGGTFGT